MEYDESSVQKILSVSRIRGNGGDWCPAVQIVGDHDGDAVWVAALIYNIYARYLQTIPDCDQHKFEQDVKEILTFAFENGQEHLDVIENFEQEE